MDERTPKAPPTIMWWIIWLAISAGVVVVYFVLATPFPKGDPGAAKYIPLAPFLASTALRWLVFPRFTDPARAFPLFVVGLALAEGSALVGIVLNPAIKQEYLILGLAGTAQYIPTFVSRYKKPVS